MLVIGGVGLAGTIGCSSNIGAPAGDQPDQPLDYTFDHGTEGWVLNKNEGSSFFTNLGAGAPDGGSPPTVTFAGGEGEPSPGSLRLTVAFTGPAQYVAAGAVVGQVGQGGSVYGGWELSGTVQALVRLVSGPGAGVLVHLYACESDAPLGTICVVGPTIKAGELAGVAWTPLAIVFNFPTEVYELGIEAYTPMPADGGAPDGGATASSGDLVFEIDSVTE